MRQKKRIFTFTPPPKMTKFLVDLQFVSSSLFLCFCDFFRSSADLHKKRNVTRRSFPIPTKFSSETESESILKLFRVGAPFVVVVVCVVAAVVRVVVAVGAAHAHSWRCCCCCCCWERLRSRNEPVAGCEANEMRATVLRAVELSVPRTQSRLASQSPRNSALCWLTATSLLMRC